jgi:multimeric flavodoxin WrbA
MTKVLGLIGSARRWGNSDLLVRQALLGAQAEGAAIQVLRLTDLDLASCTGCMRCVIGGKPCPLEDDMSWLIETIQDASGLVVAAPTYFLGVAAVIKLILDRLLMVTGRVDTPLARTRPAVTIATAGLHDWRGVTLPYLNALSAALGFQPMGSLTAIAPGPGEVLLDDELMARVLEMGRRIGQRSLDSDPVPVNVCPFCRCDAFVLRAERAICPICGHQADIEMGPDGIQLRFEATDGAQHRWTPEGLRTHMTEWVMATGPRFLAKRPEIKARRRPYRQMAVEWLCPPSSTP